MTKLLSFVRQHKVSIAVLFISCSVIAVLGWLYVFQLAERCATTDALDPDSTWPCRGYVNGHGLSQIYPIYWIAYLGIAVSVTLLFLFFWLRNGDRSGPFLWRTVLLNVAIFYVLYPFTWNGLDWHGDMLVITILVGGLATFPTSLLPLSFGFVFKVSGPIYPGPDMFGWANLHVSSIHFFIILSGYFQYYYLPGLFRAGKRKKATVILSVLAVPFSLILSSPLWMDFWFEYKAEKSYEVAKKIILACPKGANQKIEKWGKTGYSVSCQKNGMNHGEWRAVNNGFVHRKGSFYND